MKYANIITENVCTVKENNNISQYVIRKSDGVWMEY